MTWRLLSKAALTLSLTAGAALAADKEHPDWPCLQKKVENLAANQVWDGPAIDTIKEWDKDETVAALVKQLVLRKFTIDEVTASLKKYAEALPDAERNQRLTTVFAGLFETMATERRTIMSGIEKYNRSQRKRAADVEEKGKALAELESKAGADETAAAELAKAQDDYEWQTRIFKERNDNLPIACELPVLIDQRLFDLAKTIRGLMKS